MLRDDQRPRPPLSSPPRDGRPREALDGGRSEVPKDRGGVGRARVLRRSDEDAAGLRRGWASTRSAW